MMTMHRHFLGVLLLFLLPAPSWAESAAKALFVTGSPVVTAITGQVRPLLRGGELASGDSLNTADGRVQLRFADGASMSLVPGSQFRIDAFRFSERGNGPGSGDGVAMTLIKGALRTVTGLLGKENYRQYRLETSVATIGVRGTEYGATFDGSGLSVTTYAGRVEVCSDVACQLIGPGETVWVDGRAEPPRVQPRSAAMPEAEWPPALPQAPANALLPGPAPQTTSPAAAPTATATPMSVNQSPSANPGARK
jgi:hypothetical protein